VVAASLQPAPVADLVEVLGRCGLALTVEAHYVNGGLGSRVAEVIAEHGIGCRLVRCGVRAAPDGITGSQAFLQHRHGLSAQGLAEIGLAALSGARR
jgi:transketolase